MMTMKNAHRIAHRDRRIVRSGRGIVRSGLYAGLIGFAVLVSGCSLTSPDYQFNEDSLFHTPVDNLGYRDKFPIGVRSVTKAVELPGKNGQERLTASEIRRISDMAMAFMDEKQNQLVVAIPGGGAGDARVLGRAKQIGDLAKRRGVPASRMMLIVNSEDTSANGPIVISFDTLVVTVPECGIFDRESSHDETNTSEPNFGCSLQRNFGLMIDDPRDLIEPRKTTATHDATRSGVVLQAYRAGEITGAIRADVESSSTITAD